MAVDNTHVEHLANKLLSFQRQNLFCDTAIVTKDRMVFMHANVLAAVCPNLFVALNQRPFVTQKPNIVDLGQFESSLIVELVEFFYTGQLDVDRIADLQSVCTKLGIALKVTEDGDSCLTEISTKASTSVFETVNTIVDAVHESFIVKRLHQNVSGKGRNENRAQTIGKSLCSVIKSENLSIVSNPSSVSCSNGYVCNSNLVSTAPKSTVLIVPSERNVSSVHGITKVEANDSMTNIVCASRRGRPRKKVATLPPENKLIIQDAIILDGAGKTRTSERRTSVPTAAANVCLICDESFASERMLNVHKYSHNRLENGKYQCHICMKLFDVREYLRKHIRTHRHTAIGDDSAPVSAKKARRNYVCTVCGCRLRTPARLRSHMNSHTGEKPFVCNVCQKGFSDGEYLVKHMRLHSGERPYLCADCGVSFAFRQAYTIHRRVHTGERPYACTDCGRQFSQSCGLRVHRRTHTSEKLHRCDQCGKAFSDGRQLDAHRLLRHTDDTEKQHRCRYCPKLFAKSYHLRQHERCHNREFGCTECGRMFSSQVKITKHVQKCKKISTTSNIGATCSDRDAMSDCRVLSQ